MARSLGAAATWRVVLLSTLAGAGVARADAPPDADLKVHLFDVGGLVRGSPWFRAVRGPFGPTPDAINDEERPLFGAEGEEPVTAYGSVDELIERLKSVGPPGAWDREGVSIKARGNRALVVRGPADLAAEVDRALDAFERDALATVVLDVVALHADAAAAWVSGAPETPARSDAVLACARACGFPGQRLTAFSGGQRAYLADYDVEVSVDAKTPDPIVLTQPDGIALEATATIVGEEVHLDLSAWLARVEAIEPRQTKDVTLEAARVAAGEASTSRLRVRPGAWAILSASGDVAFAVRAAVEPPPPRAPSTPLPALSGMEGPLVSRTWNVLPLTTAPVNRRGRDLWISPSNWTPPEPPELPEPRPVMDPDSLVELVRTLAPESVWSEDGAQAEVRYGRLHARLREGAAPAVDAFLADLLQRLVRVRRLDATVVSLPRGAYTAASASTSGPGASVREALAARDGAKVEARVSVRIVGDQRSSAFSGREHAYVGDYDVEIAEKAIIGNPIVLRALEGFALDVDAAGAAGGAALACDLRCDRAVWRASPPRTLGTPHGDVELPDVALQRVRGSFVAVPGTSRLVSLGVEGDRLVAVVVEVVAE